MQPDKEFEALKNAADNIEAFVHIKHTQDKRKVINRYFLTINGISVSPVLPYDEMNAFILGWVKCKRLTNILQIG